MGTTYTIATLNDIVIATVPNGADEGGAAHDPRGRRARDGRRTRHRDEPAGRQ